MEARSLQLVWGLGCARGSQDRQGGYLMRAMFRRASSRAHVVSRVDRPTNIRISQNDTYSIILELL